MKSTNKRFKIGDLVIRIDNDYYDLKIGETFIVAKVSEEGKYLTPEGSHAKQYLSKYFKIKGSDLELERIVEIMREEIELAL